jgi:Ca-activated chloride channel family protein
MSRDTLRVGATLATIPRTDEACAIADMGRAASHDGSAAAQDAAGQSAAPRAAATHTRSATTLENEQVIRRASVPRFRSAVDLVGLDVCVKDRAGRFVPGLTARDFLIAEDNVLQRVAFFSSDDRSPLAVTLLIDRSASMTGTRLERATSAGLAFLQSLRSDDLVEVLAFNQRVDRPLPLSGDRIEAERALREITAEGTTGLFEAVLVGLRDLALARRQRTDYRFAMVVLSDGENTSSRLSIDDVLEDVQRSGVLIYSVSLHVDEKGRALPPLHQLSQLAYNTGGRIVSIQSLDQLAPLYQEIAAALRHLYRVGYHSSNTVRNGEWRRVVVQVVNDRDARVRTRPGYFAPREAAYPAVGERP